MAFSFDSHRNFVITTIATPPSPAAPSNGATSVFTVVAGTGALFPAPPFDCVVYTAGVFPTNLNSEIVRVTNISTDTFTVTRGYEGSTVQTIIAGNIIALTVTAKNLQDIESAVNTNAGLIANNTTNIATNTANIATLTTEVAGLTATSFPDITDNNTVHNVGIYQTTPQFTLDVNGAIGNSAGILQINQYRYNTLGYGINIQANDGGSSLGGDITLAAGTGRALNILKDSGASILIQGGDDGSQTKYANICLMPGYLIPSFGGPPTLRGKVGVNTLTPAYTVDVGGDINFSGNLYQNGVLFTSGGGGSGSFPDITDISATHRIGINQTTPLYTLDVNGLIGNSQYSHTNTITLDDGSGNMQFHSSTYKLNTTSGLITVDGNGNIYGGNIANTYASYFLGANGTNSYLAYNGGNVGIFNNSPLFLLDVNGVVGNSLGAFQINQTTTTHSGYGINLTADNSATSGGSVTITAGNTITSGYVGGNLTFSAGTGKHLTTTYSGAQIVVQGGDDGAAASLGNIILSPGTNVNGTGRIGINQSSPAYTVDVTGSINFTGSLYQNGVLFTGGTTYADITDNSSTHKVGIGQTNPQFTLDVNGNIGNSTNGNSGYIQLANTSGQMVFSPALVTMNNATLVMDYNGILQSNNNTNGTVWRLGSYGSASYLGIGGGPVGIGLQLPEYTLDVNGTIGNSAGVATTLQQGTTTFSIKANGAIFNSGNTRFRSGKGWQFFNATTSLWHTLLCTNNPPAIGWDAGESDTI